jgi:pimeloyl-ACP methyl ester carboxylesterase
MKQIILIILLYLVSYGNWLKGQAPRAITCEYQTSDGTVRTNIPAPDAEIRISVNKPKRFSTSTINEFYNFIINVEETPINLNPIYDKLLEREAKGTAYVYFGCGSRKCEFKKPLILVEGYDPFNGTSLCDLFLGLGDIPDSLSGFIRQRRLEGYDVIFLDFDWGADFIQNNAAVFKELITRVNGLKVTNIENVVVGASMGGLIAQYGLLELENEGVDHFVGLCVSLDSPHGGANVPFGLQCLSKRFYNYTFKGNIFEAWNGVADLINGLTSFFGAIFGAEGIDISIDNVLKESYELNLNSPAAKQMMSYHINNEAARRLYSLTTGFPGYGVHPFVRQHELRTEYLRQLDDLGTWPVL